MKTLGLNRKTTGADLVAGISAGVAAIPDAMASGVLAGISPVYGLYGVMIGTPVAALFTGSALMSVVTTSAMAIAIGGILDPYQGGDQLISALVTLTLIIGVVQLGAGLLRLGFLIRFVSNAVMTGFLTGLSILIILGQLGDLTGYDSPYSNKVVQAIDTFQHIGELNTQTTLVGIFTILMIVLLSRTRLENFALFIALVISAVFVQLAGLSQVALVGSIPSGFPLPQLPQLVLSPDIITGGIAVAIIGLVQGAGVSQAYMNPDGKYPDVSRDFVGQGIANSVLGFFQGLPLGGSLSSTALIVSAGAKSRLANIFAGLVVMAGVLLFSNQIEILPMTALAAILIVAGVQSINPQRIRTVWQTSISARGVMLFTLIVTLIVPIQVAVLLGILAHFVIHIFRASDKVRLMEVVLRDDGLFEERASPKELRAESVTVLVPHGSLFFAGAIEMEENFPQVGKAQRAIVILNMRARDEVGSTFLRVIERYNQQLRANGGKLVLTGVALPVREQMIRTGAFASIGEENIYTATPIIGETTRRAARDARVWLESAPAAESKSEQATPTK